MNRRKLTAWQRIFTTITLIVTMATFVLSVSAEAPISVALRRNMGSEYDNNMSGDWTLRAEGPSNIIFIAVFFNGSMKANASSNEISWNFQTENYEVGTYNITVIGWDAQGNQYQSDSIIRNFMKSNDALILGIIGGIAGLVGLIALIRYVRNKRKGPEPKIQKTDVSLTLDKDLL